jgi:hypothetical protein
MHSSFWLPKHWLDSWKETKPGTLKYSLKLSAVRRGVSNFVRITTGEEIPVRFSSGKMSYATREDGITISADNNPEMLDATVGTALHEAAHLILSRRTNHEESIPLYTWLEWGKNVPEVVFPDALITKAVNIGLDAHTLMKHYKKFLNILEDRRIDSWMYEHAVGYRPYYDELYNKHWHSAETTILLMHPLTHVPTIRNYEFHVTNISNPVARPDALPGLQDIWNLINLDDIRRFGRDEQWAVWEKLGHITEAMVKAVPLPEMIRCVLGIMDIIYSNAQQFDGNDPQSDEDQQGDELEPSDEDQSQDPNYDIPDEEAIEEEQVARRVDEQNSRTDHLLDDQFDKEPIDEEDQERVEAMESSGVSCEQAGGDEFKTTVFVFSKLSEDVLNNDEFPLSNGHRGRLSAYEYSAQAVLDGDRLGEALAHRLLLLSDERVLHHPRQVAGKLDKRRISALGYDDDSVFARTEVETHRPVDIHLSIDASGSMKEMKWARALALGVALAKVASVIPRLNVTVSARSGMSNSNSAAVAILYDSRHDHYSQVRRFFPYLKPDNGTPEGLVFETLKQDILTRSKTARRYFINISDGVPDFVTDNTSHYTGQNAWAHTRRQVKEIEQEGVRVMSYFVTSGVRSRYQIDMGDPKEAFRIMYGKSANFINPENVVDIARTLNSLLIK